MNTKPTEYNWEIGGGWGNHISWSSHQFDNGIDPNGIYSVYGHKPFDKPKKGDTLLAEFQYSWIIFEFVSVNRTGDPPDMFFGKVQPLRRIMK